MQVQTKDRWLRIARLAIGLLLVATAAQHFYALYQPNTLAAKLPLTPMTEGSSDSLAPALDTPEYLLAEVKLFTRAVFENSGHCDVSDLRLSWLENSILALNPFSNLFQQGVLVRERFRCGYCHQRSFLLLEMLQERFDRFGSAAQMLGLSGHVVLQFEVAGRTFLTDPDYGVGPFEYHSEDSELSREISKTYAEFQNLNQLLAIYLSRNDNLAYSSTDGFNQIKSKQQRWFLFSDVASVFLALLGAILIGSSVRRHS